MHEYDLDLEDEELFEQTKRFPYIVTKLPKVWYLFFIKYFTLSLGRGDHPVRAQRLRRRGDLSPAHARPPPLLRGHLLQDVEEELQDARWSFLLWGEDCPKDS